MLLALGLSVIIPIGKEDQSWKRLLPDLAALSPDDEIIFVSSESNLSDFAAELEKVQIKTPFRSIQSSQGRARQLNLGAKDATREILWFLHCDSRISSLGIRKLKDSISRIPNQILFFDLKFLNDGPGLTSINEVGAWFRSRLLRLPFGDQGFCMSKTTFTNLGGFNEKAAYGEDHLLIWKAHQIGISIKCIGSGLKTSARKYTKLGWSKTTTQHVTLTLRQAFPELIRLIASRRPS